VILADLGTKHFRIQSRAPGHRVLAQGRSLLDEAKRARFSELAVFPEDADIPIDTIARLWAKSGNLDGVDTEDLLDELHNLSLLLSLDLDQRSVQLHDVVRHFLLSRVGHQALTALHKCLADVIDPSGALTDIEPSTQRYHFRLLPYHLAAAGERKRLDALVLDPGCSGDRADAGDAGTA
jgi:hypothetical protein